MKVRSRTWLVDQVTDDPGYGSTVELSCVDDDAQGDQLLVDWNLELDARIVSEEAWKDIGKRGFDPPRQFAAFLNTLRWNCVTATNPRLFQSPFRAGIRIDPYQLEPLAKALRLPRVNLFIADDVGLGKTIEAGLIASELLLRRRIRDIVVACPPSMLLQWQDELENRFGLTFEIFDRAYMERIRRERGHAVNPWTTFPRFLISHKLLIDETYVAPMRDWLDNLRPGSLLIFDEAHHAAPAHGSKYAIDSKITRAVRQLAFRFEHRLFLSATPHNGHSNSFSSLLEILDRERFIRGVKVTKENRDAVMIRRLKEDLREIGIPGFPKRHAVQVDLPEMLPDPAPFPQETPELLLPRLLEEYRNIRLQGALQDASKRQRSHFELLVTNLQQRLLSSVEAFHRTLKVHRQTMERLWAREIEAQPQARVRGESLTSVDSEDDRANLDEAELDQLFDLETEKATLAAAASTSAPGAEERQLLERMAHIAAQARLQPDAKIRYLIQWIRQHQCSGAALPADGGPQSDAAWKDRRVILFTEWDDTKRYLKEQLETAIQGTDRWEERIEVFHGPTPFDKKEALKRAFNTPPDQHPIRILICTDAAREGLNLQAHCQDLFHFDVPWNPARMEQRNGRIDRKLQPASDVRCHYFVYTQRPEDKVLRVLARKTRTIKDELGSFTDVISGKLKGGIRAAEAEATARDLDSLQDAESEAIREEELESNRLQHQALREEIQRMERRLEESAKAIQFRADQLQDAISCSLELIESQPLQAAEPGRFVFPDLETQRGQDPHWTRTLDTLRPPPEQGKKDYAWRAQSPIRPVTFEAPEGIDDSVVQLHLSHRLVQRLLGRFASQGFLYDDLSRACLAQADDNIPRVVLLGRLSVYGPRASRLHEELLTITARWSPPAERKEPLKPYARDAEQRTLDLLHKNLGPEGRRDLPKQLQAPLLQAIPQDVEELHQHLAPRGAEALEKALEHLTQRGKAEAEDLTKVLLDQRKRVLRQLELHTEGGQELLLSEEKRQRDNDIQHWKAWLQNVDGDLQVEPARIREFYTVQSHRIEPVGLIYLIPTQAS